MVLNRTTETLAAKNCIDMNVSSISHTCNTASEKRTLAAEAAAEVVSFACWPLEQDACHHWVQHPLTAACTNSRQPQSQIDPPDPPIILKHSCAHLAIRYQLLSVSCPCFHLFNSSSILLCCSGTTHATLVGLNRSIHQ